MPGNPKLPNTRAGAPHQKNKQINRPSKDRPACPPRPPPPGEEENGSIGFREAVEANLRWFAGSAAVVISNTLWVGERLPCLTYGMRGMIRWR